MKTYPLMDIHEFQFLINSLSLRYFKWKEFLHGTDYEENGVKNSPPPAELMFNIVPLALLLDEALHRLGKPMYFTSVYRNPEYNGAVGGSSGSSHQDFTAADVVVDGVEPRLVAKTFERLVDRPIVCPIDLDFPRTPHPLWKSFKPVGLRIEKTGAGTAFIYQGGIHAYNTFTHVDVRGWHARW